MALSYQTLYGMLIAILQHSLMDLSTYTILHYLHYPQAVGECAAWSAGDEAVIIDCSQRRWPGKKLLAANIPRLEK